MDLIPCTTVTEFEYGKDYIHENTTELEGGVHECDDCKLLLFEAE